MANIYSSQQFFSSLSNASIVTHIIPQYNTTIINIEAGSGVASSAKPLNPAILHLHKGDTVTWVNNHNVHHSITSLLFDSGIIWPKGSIHGSSTFSHTFNQTGTTAYVDHLHPYLGGVIYVDVPTIYFS